MIVQNTANVAINLTITNCQTGSQDFSQSIQPGASTSVSLTSDFTYNLEANAIGTNPAVEYSIKADTDSVKLGYVNERISLNVSQ